MADRIRLEGADRAPVLTFDGVPMLGITEGSGRVSLEVRVHDEAADGTIITRRIVVAHLRGSRAAFESLRDAINKMDLLAKPAQQGETGKPN